MKPRRKTTCKDGDKYVEYLESYAAVLARLDAENEFSYFEVDEIDLSGEDPETFSIATED